MKKLFIVLLACLSLTTLTACNDDAHPTGGYRVEIVQHEQTYNIKEYKSLTIYLYGNQIDEWKDASSGITSRLIKYYDKLTLHVIDDQLHIQGTWKTNEDKYITDITYVGSGYDYKLIKQELIK